MFFYKIWILFKWYENIRKKIFEKFPEFEYSVDNNIKSLKERIITKKKITWNRVGVIRERDK